MYTRQEWDKMVQKQNKDLERLRRIKKGDTIFTYNAFMDMFRNTVVSVNVDEASVKAIDHSHSVGGDREVVITEHFYTMEEAIAAGYIIPDKEESSTIEVPIEEAERIARDYKKQEVVIITWDRKSNMQTVTTFGGSKEESLRASENGNLVKRHLLRWPEEQCNAKPSETVLESKETKVLTIAGNEIPEDVRAIFMICELREDKLKCIAERFCTDKAVALEYYANVPNPESQLVAGETYEELITELKALKKKWNTPEFTKQLKATI